MHPTSLRNCPAPAKLNLFLHVTGRRADGYHLLQSVFQLIDRCDELDFDLRADGAIRRANVVPGVPEEEDLTVRAARLLAAEAQAAGRPFGGADITVRKRLPMGGGLGGGSSDAATTLLALNHLWRCGFSRSDLMAFGLRLGADVPFFLFGQNAFAEGVGEALTALDTPSCWYVVVEPGVMVPTAAIFCDGDLTRDSEPVIMADFSSSQPGGSGKPAYRGGFGRNDLQPVAARRFGPVADALEWLGRFGDARMTGSGACVFCAFGQEAEADRVLQKAGGVWLAWKAQALSAHPLAEWCGNAGQVDAGR